VDLLTLRDQACRYGCPATAQALDLAVEMLEVEQSVDFQSLECEDVSKS